MSDSINYEVEVSDLDPPSRSRQHSFGSNSWGMFALTNFQDQAVEVRNAWLALAENPSYAYGQRRRNNHGPVNVIYQWSNPSPSVSMKHLSSDGNLPDIPSDSMELSCYVDGFRIAQYLSGEIKAEFCLAFSYGSRSYLSWKSYTEIEQYYKTLYIVHTKIKPIFPKTLREWEDLQARKKWYRGLDVPYLKEKSIYIGRVIQSSLMECPTPGLLLEFLNH
jgi:hypothetical protein